MEYDEDCDDCIFFIFNSSVFGIAGHCMVNSGKRRVPSLVVCTGRLGFDDEGAIMILALVMMMVMVLMAIIMMMMMVMTNAKRRVSSLVVYTGPSDFEDDDRNDDVDVLIVMMRMEEM